MRILIIVAALFVLSGCGTLALESVSVGIGHRDHGHHNNYISYNLGFYSGHYFNSYRVYGVHGHRYYYAPPNYAYHQHYYAPPVVHYVHPRPHHTPPRNHHNDRRHHRNHYRDHNYRRH